MPLYDWIKTTKARLVNKVTVESMVYHFGKYGIGREGYESREEKRVENAVEKGSKRKDRRKMEIEE
jgi:hypothetical protein